MARLSGWMLILLATAFSAAGLGQARRSLRTPAAFRDPSPRPSAGFGAIKGRLVWKNGVEIPPIRLLYKKGANNIKDRAVCAVEDILSDVLIVDPKTRGVKNGFAFLVNPKGSNPAFEKAFLAKAPEFGVEQKNCRFRPYAVAVWVQQALVYRTPDPVDHNIRARGKENTFNWTSGRGSTRVFQLAAEKSPMRVVCDVHDWETSIVGVYDHPFFALTALDGSFEIKGVPAGLQRLSVWHELQGFATKGATRGQEVEVPAGGTVDVGEVTLDVAKVLEALKRG